MKKHLLSTSAIALGVAMAAPATAQQWDMNWGGFYSAHVGYADVGGTITNPAGTDFDGVNVFTTGEIIFSPSVTLDNGMTFGINVQYEAHTNTGGVDESYLSISSDTLGRIDIGNENSAGYKSMIGAPTVTSMWINSPSASAFIPRTGVNTFRQAALSSYTEVAGNNDVERISYYTPDFNGLTVGVSYARTANAGQNVSHNYNINKGAATVADVFDIGASYSQSFGDSSVTLGARYGTGDSNVGGISDPETWGIGGQFSFAGFTLGASYTENDNGAPTGVGDQEGWSLGMTYDVTGPWSVEALTYQGTIEAGAVDSDYEAYKVGASRDLGPGVDWDVYFVYQDTNNGATGATADGSLIGTAINLSF
ncbi:porin [Roseovarius sp. TE539]|uniref:porin n=1 Tax=Roseovarius sp. TE539 TaxID=2249812 RepID=UPI00215CEC18|nr:porin [Roseovarius sp. TE539]